MSSVTIPLPRSGYTEPQRVTVGPIEVAFRRNGRGDPVLFLHGAGMTRRWLPFYECMATGCDFIAPEHPGFGETPPSAEIEDFDDVILHYRSFLDALGLSRVHVVGWSLGGWMAAEFSVFWPERVSSLTLITPAGLRVADHPLTDIFGMPPVRIAEVLFSGDVAPYVEYLPDPSSLDEMVQTASELAAAARLMWSPRYDRKLDRRLPRVRVPALIVGATDDWLVPNAHVDRYAELLPEARSVRIPRTGHAVVIQEPERAATTVLSFIKEVGP